MKNVLIIDSGSGGINILSHCLKICPCNNYLLFLDQKNLPYGEKSEEELKEIAVSLVKTISSFFGPEVVVIGCNTLTSVAISLLRHSFPKITFVGSEPAILPALKSFKTDEILVLATKVTIKNSKVLKDFQSICFAPQNLPKVIDENLFNREAVENYLKKVLKGKHPKAVVLGCTHFEGIKKELTKVLGDVVFFESGEGIAKRLKTFSDDSKSFQVQIMTSKNPENLSIYFEYLKTLID